MTPPEACPFAPIVPEDDDGALEELATTLIAESSRLGGWLRPALRAPVVELVRSMNGYYSNLIEGHRTLPQDIDRALSGRFRRDASRRLNQELHRAHVEAQAALEASPPALAEVPSAGWIRKIHEEIFRRLSPAARVADIGSGPQTDVVPGQLRRDRVSVGRHDAPDPDALDRLLEMFEAAYAPLVRPTPRGLIAAMAAHHRLVWIHPFADGNGRVARLFTQSWLRACGQDAGGLWALSRGLARARGAYWRWLSEADTPATGASGLSAQALHALCRNMLETCVDQARFMGELLGLDRFRGQLEAVARMEEAKGNLPSRSAELVGHLAEIDALRRGAVAGLLRIPERTAQRMIRAVVGAGFAFSDTPKGPLRLRWPAVAHPFLFPGLYPAGGEADED